MITGSRPVQLAMVSVGRESRPTPGPLRLLHDLADSLSSWSKTQRPLMWVAAESADLPGENRCYSLQRGRRLSQCPSPSPSASSYPRCLACTVDIPGPKGSVIWNCPVRTTPGPGRSHRPSSHLPTDRDQARTRMQSHYSKRRIAHPFRRSANLGPRRKRFELRIECGWPPSIGLPDRRASARRLE
jgi:hypothetical protein